MTPCELSEARRDLGFPTQNDFAAYLGVSRAAVARWETGTTAIPGPIERIIELLEELHDHDSMES